MVIAAALSCLGRLGAGVLHGVAHSSIISSLCGHIYFSGYYWIRKRSVCQRCTCQAARAAVVGGFVLSSWCDVSGGPVFVTIVSNGAYSAVNAMGRSSALVCVDWEKWR